MLIDNKRITLNRVLELFNIELNTLFKAIILSINNKEIELIIDDKLIKIRKPKYLKDNSINEYRNFIIVINGKNTFRLVEVFAKIKK